MITVFCGTREISDKRADCGLIGKFDGLHKASEAAAEVMRYQEKRISLAWCLPLMRRHREP